MTEWTYFANLFPPFRIGFSIVKGDRLLHGFHGIDRIWKHVKTRMYVYIYELDRDIYFIRCGYFMQPMNTFKTTVLLFYEIDRASQGNWSFRVSCAINFFQDGKKGDDFTYRIKSYTISRFFIKYPRMTMINKIKKKKKEIYVNFKLKIISPSLVIDAIVEG